MNAVLWQAIYRFIVTLEFFSFVPPLGFDVYFSILLYGVWVFFFLFLVLIIIFQCLLPIVLLILGKPNYDLCYL